MVGIFEKLNKTGQAGLGYTGLDLTGQDRIWTGQARTWTGQNWT